MTEPCPTCHGNGYVGSGLNVVGCPSCDSEGEVEARPRATILDEAKQLICHDRAKQHGDAGANLTKISNYWGEFLDHAISSSEAAKMMALLKIARDHSNPSNDDNLRDAIGYLALAHEQKRTGR